MNVRWHSNLLSLDAHVYYWMAGALHVWWEPIPITGQCGWDDEPARELNIGLDSAFRWTPEWGVAADTNVRRVDAVNRCLLTIRDIDVTDRIKELATRLLSRGADTIDEHIAQVARFRDQAAQLWARLQEPIAVGPRSWIVLTPMTASAGPLVASESTPPELSVAFSITGNMFLRFGDRPAPQPVPLPALDTTPTPPSAFTIVSDVPVSLDAASAALRPLVTGQEFTVDRRRLRIRDIRLYGSGDKVVLEVSIDGTAGTLTSLNGVIYLSGRPSYSSRDRAVVISDLAFDPQTAAVIQAQAPWILGTNLQEWLKNTIRIPVGAELDQLSAELDQALSTVVLNEHATLEGNVNSVSVENIFVEENTLLVRAMIAGDAVVTIGSAVFGGVPPPSAAQCPQERGWFVRICDDPQLTEADGVRLEVGVGGTDEGHRFWREWRRGEQAEFGVPVDLHRAKELWIRATALPEGKNVNMCVGFNEHITQKMTFNEDEVHETSRDDSDGCDCQQP